MTLEEFRKKFLGKQVEFHSYGAGALNQCVDLVNMYINLCLDNETKDYTEIIGTNAKDFKDNYDPKDFDFIANDTSPNVVPERGDVIIWNGNVGGGAGHVAINLEANDMNIHSLDQNWSQAEYVTEEDHPYTNVSGWLRPKYFIDSSLQIKIDALEQELSEMRESRDRWKSDYKDLEEKYTEELSESQEHLSHILEDMANLNAELLSTQRTVETLKEELKSCGEARGALEDAYKKRTLDYDGCLKEMDKLYERIANLQQGYKKISFWEFLRIKLGGEKSEN